MSNQLAILKMRISVFLVLLFTSLCLSAQEDITALEYFIDIDPGVGNGIAVTIPGGQTINESFSISTDALSPGYHVLGIRTRNSQNRWSMYERRLFLIQDPADDLGFPNAISNITAVEYFIDDDPGLGLGTSISTAGGATINESININTDALSPGYHLIGVRVQNAEGRWSMYERRLFLIQDPNDNLGFPRTASNISAAEYFIDDDPGFGSGTAISTTGGSTISESISINTDALSPGYHILSARTQNDEGRWSMYERRLFLIQDPNDNLGFPRAVSNITTAEYFIDDDPGLGSGTPITTAGGASITETININTDALGTGYHLLGVRSQNAEGRWSMFERRLFLIQDPQDNLGFPRSASNIGAAEYFIDDDPGVGNGAAITTTGGASIAESIAINTDALSPGYHILGVRTQNQENRWGKYERRLFLIQDPQDDLGFPSAPSQIEELEFFVDEDPGPGNGINIPLDMPVDVLDLIDLMLTIDPMLQAGTHTFAIRAKNADGKWGFVETRTFEFTGAPTPILTSDAPNYTNNPVVYLNISFGDTVSGFEESDVITLLNDSPTDPTLVRTSSIADSTNGVFSVILDLVDEGEVGVFIPEDAAISDTTLSLASDTLRFIYDITAPTITVDALSTTEVSPELTGAIDDTLATVSINIDGSDYPATVNTDNTWVISQGTITDLLTGSYDVVATATDLAGNSSTDVSNDEINIIDPSNPLPTLIYTGNSITNQSPWNITVDFSVDVTGFDTTDIITLLDGNTGTSFVQFGSLLDNADGSFDFIVEPVEGEISILIPEAAAISVSEGGTNSASDTLRIVYDITAPSVTINSISTSETSPELTGTIDDILATVNINIDGSDYLATVNSDNTWTLSQGAISDLTVGIYDVVASANDLAGNIGTDATANEVEILEPSEDGISATDSLVLVTFYNETGGASWTDNTNWLIGGQSINSWFGIALNAEETEITEINLPFNGLSGTIPLALDVLDSLVILDLSGNNIDALATDLTAFVEATSIDLSGNRLDFGDLESIVGIPSLNYGNQQDIDAINQDDLVIRAGTDQTLTTTTPGTANLYQWTLNGNDISNANDSSFTIINIDASQVGNYGVVVSNSIVTGLELSSTEIEVLANAVVTVNALDDDIQITDLLNGYLFSLNETVADTVANAPVSIQSPIDFPEVLLGSYLVAVESILDIEDANLKYIPTFYGDALSEDAEILLLERDTTINISIIKVPEPPQGVGSVIGTIEEDFPDDESRVDTRRRAKKRKCGLRRRRTGGRTGQEDDEFELIAYGETNDNGEFEYGFLPEGTYRFFVEYPGIPLDESAFVQFDIGEAGVSDTEFVLAVFASPEGITIEIVLGITTDYFVDFNIYPNPTTDILHIEYAQIKLEDVTMEIVNIEGKVMYSKKLDRAKKKELYDTSLLSPGQYLVRFTGGGNVDPLVYRIIKK